MAKKDFTKNPALQFISTPTEEPSTTTEPPVGYKVDPAFIETKSRRVQILVQPSVFAAVDRIARRKGISRNEAISEALKQYAEREG